MKERIERGLTALGIDAPGGAAALAEYGRLLLEQNQVMNLTAITAPDQVADPALFGLCGAFERAGDLLRRKIPDRRGHRRRLPRSAAAHSGAHNSAHPAGQSGQAGLLAGAGLHRLGAQDVKCLHARAEEQALLPGFRDCFDLAAARAVAPLALLCELCLPFVAVGGFFLAMKSVDCGADLEQAGRCVSRLGGAAAQRAGTTKFPDGGQWPIVWLLWKRFPQLPRDIPAVGKNSESPALTVILPPFCTKND